MKRKNKNKSKIKKRLVHISNNLIALMAVLVTMASIIVDYNIYQNAKSRLAGEVVSTGIVGLCLNNRPGLANCQSTAAVGTLYTCNIDEDTSQILTVSDNSSLFSAPSGGSINFTPASANVGFHAIRIDVSDNSGCSNSDNTLLLNLTINGTTSTPSGGTVGGGAGGGAGGGGGGGGGGAPNLPLNETAPLAEFVVDRDMIKIILKQYETKTSSFQIKNTANIEIDVSIDTDLGKYITFEDKIITLGPGEERWISFDAKVADEPGIYTGRISLISVYQKKEIKLVLEVHSVVSLFDVKVSVQKQYRQVKQGDTVAADIALINIGDPTEVKLYYSIMDLNNKNIVSSEETIYAKEPLMISRELKPPEDINIGKYLFYVRLTAGSNKAFATDIFEVVKVPFINFPALFNFEIKVAVILIFVVLLIATYYNINRRKLKKEGQKDVSGFDIELSLHKINPKRLENLRNKINKELDVLNADYQSDYISFEEYKKKKGKIGKSTGKIKNQLGKLK